ncbi:hypothetical protein [Candidatus Magnetominusculus xianensis]|uniref:Uncharacterized protein n=1 Tax=Candidatus Magnetominusculus xianensis TaxID=1748249 RepID=A0ABR5SJC0_9BACT|nr:hypothetical protein [Candidatus Magnetominusculus xianensis]KWT94371.1 hypothetical protein ASN18_0256 [Candidatus Magnetominusculus xianensis]MBF0403979.1 hypothetical protein [Nitrospirota bacterium]
MEIDISIDGKSLSIDVENPFKADLPQMTKEITDFGTNMGIELSNLDIKGLLGRMIKGVSGCEHGCPADAKSLVYHGYGKFKLNYVDGGILSASCELQDKKSLELKVFPEF